MRTALTIAGSDPSGGAGIQADLKTFAAHGVYGFSAITAVTAQNSVRVMRSEPVAPDVLTAQLDAIFDDFDVHAIKIGMLATAANTHAVIRALSGIDPRPIVLDPVLVSTSGTPLLEPAGVDRVRRLLSSVSVVTPNAAEAAALTGRPVTTIAERRDAAAQLVAIGARAVIVTGGDGTGPAVDLVYDRGVFTELTGERIATRHAHGTGCTFSAAIAARLARGDDLLDAARSAKAYVERALRGAPGLGHGRGPMGHL